MDQKMTMIRRNVDDVFFTERWNERKILERAKYFIGCNMCTTYGRWYGMEKDIVAIEGWILSSRSSLLSQTVLFLSLMYIIYYK